MILFHKGGKMILTQNSGMIMGPISKLLGFIFNAIYNLFFGMGVESIALSIVVFTIIVRLLMFPLNIKQTRSSKIQQYLKPEFNKINKKYKGKKDQESMLAQQKETRELQEKYGIKMTQGCLTSILQFPIFIGLYNVIQNIPAYVPKVRALYEPIATAIYNSDKAYPILEAFVKDNKISRLSSKLAEFTSATSVTSEEGVKTFNSIIDILYRCNDDLFAKLGEVFSANPEVASAIAQNQADISRVNHFLFGINLTEAPGFKLSPALLIPILSFVCQLLAMLVTPMNETGDPQQDAQMKSMRRSMYFMPLMSFAVTVSAPAGLGIYWAMSAFISFLITVLQNVYYNHVDMEKLVEKAQEKAAKNIEKRKASGKKSLMEKFQEAAMGADPSEEESKSTNKNLNKYSNMNLRNFDSEADDVDDSDSADTESSNDTDSSKSKPKKGSLADRANAVKRFNDTGVN
jgi:membrane protein insertase, YidC/Oxa1 family, C-terminal domain